VRNTTGGASGPACAGDRVPVWGQVVLSAGKPRNVLPPSRGCYCADEKIFVCQGGAISSGQEEDNATRDIARGPGTGALFEAAST
jgi:hypothetical protein